ncbi:MAG: M24 family metallopeptidase [Gemmatimonadota bacterium]
MKSRLDDVRGVVADGRLTGLLVTSLANIRYLSGFTGSSGVLLVEPRSTTLFTDFRYETQAASEVEAGICVEIVADGTWERLKSWLDGSPPGRRLGYEAANLTVAERDRLAAACDGATWEPTEGLVEERRAVKDAAELESIAAAVDLADLVLETIVPGIRPPITEMQLAALLEFRLRAAGSGPLPFAPIVAFGDRSALPHATPSDRPLARGEFVLLDFGARIDGYCSDMTRVFTAGRAADWQRDLHGEVLRACEKGIAALAAGRPCAEVDAAARGSLADAGLAEQFGHSTGHGLGLEIHEAPRLHRKESRTLSAGNVVTVEPGVYLPGRGGIRIEQVAVVEAAGSRVLTRSSPELVEL